MRLRSFVMPTLLLAAAAGTAAAQTFRNDDPVIRRMWEEGMTRSQAGALVFRRRPALSRAVSVVAEILSAE